MQWLSTPLQFFFTAPVVVAMVLIGLVFNWWLWQESTLAAATDGTTQNQGGATATIGGLKTYGAAVIHDETGDREISAGLFEMSVDGGGTLQTYCVDIHNPTQRDARYHETSWGGTSLSANKDAGRIRWILQNSYPQVNDLAWSNRNFLIRACRFLAGQVGITQYLDCGSGLPTAENTHQVVQRLKPDAKVLYIDNDPVVLAHGRAHPRAGIVGPQFVYPDGRWQPSRRRFPTVWGTTARWTWAGWSSPSRHSQTSHTHSRPSRGVPSLWYGITRRTAKRAESGPLVPLRQVARW